MLALGMCGSKDLPDRPCYHLHSVVPQFVALDRISSELGCEGASVGADSDYLRNNALRELRVTLYGEDSDIGQPGELSGRIGNVPDHSLIVADFCGSKELETGEDRRYAILVHLLDVLGTGFEGKNQNANPRKGLIDSNQ